MSITEDTIRKQLRDNAVLLYMKGTPDTPKCGFSGRAVAALKQLGVSFAHVDVLENPFIREGLPKVSNFPTFPQLFVAGELVGGSDIVAEMAQSGELARLVQSALDGQAP
jgi:monothiol glutaredoxin